MEKFKYINYNFRNMKENWRKNIDPLIKDHLEAQIKESFRYRKNYIKSKNPSKAQLWCAVAVLARQTFNLSLKVKFLEKALQELVGKKKNVDDDVKAILDSLQKF